MIVKLENLEDFQKIVQKEKNVVVDFNVTWCSPCRMMSRVIEEIEERLPEVTFLKVDTDDFPELASEFYIVSIPSFAAYQNGGRVVFRHQGHKEDLHIGGMSEDDFEDMIRETFSLK